MVDPIQQRVLGVLIEKERSVPDSYPMTESALLAGCNQKSNRDPIMEVDSSEVHPALLALREAGLAVRVDGGGRVTRYRHRAEDVLNVDAAELAVMCELLLRGPQAPGALKPRVARLGLDSDPGGIRTILERLAARTPTPLVERLPRRPRERDHRWGHLLGPRPQQDDTSADDTPADDTSDELAAEAAEPPRAAPTATAALAERVARLEAEVAALRRTLEALTGG